MGYLLLVLFLSLVGILAFLPQFQPWIKKYNTGTNFFLTLSATLVGVLLAIAISDYEAANKEQQDLIKLLKAAESVVDSSYDYSEELVKAYQASASPRSAENQDAFWLKNPPPYPDYLDNLLNQNIASKNLSLEALEELNEYLFNLKKVRQSDMVIYLHFLQQIQQVLKLEQSYQAGQLALAELEMKIAQLKQQSQQFIQRQS